MPTATNDRRAYIRRRSVEVAVKDGAVAHVTFASYVSQVAYARFVVAAAKRIERARRIPK